ncbi:LAME_0F19966g1_1 [Lachancea meyersii CBS 8951]|uniref:Sm protein F n=1 Tax=Lachancea meyersii CBS 8951 TaxID=1266667 RepID=A0A1G4K1S3_9SACH|nr:LAME_0F19966g1_1 [Lachancea meyersii CBS 8951]
MSTLSPINPKPFLRDLINKKIVVTLKFNKTQYKGVLVSTDNYFNLQLSDAEEFIDSQSKGKIGDIFLRCNNVLWIGKDLSEKSGSVSADSAPAEATRGANAVLEAQETEISQDAAPPQTAT